MDARWKDLSNKELVDKFGLAIQKWTVADLGKSEYSYGDIQDMKQEILRRMGDAETCTPEQVIHRTGELVMQVLNTPAGKEPMVEVYLHEADSYLKNAWENVKDGETR